MNFQSICRLCVSGVSTWRSQSAHGGNYRLQVHAGGAERRLQRSARRFLFRSEGCLFCAASVSGYVLKQTRLTPSKFSHHFPCSQTYNSPHLELIDARSRWSCWLVGRVFRATWARRSGARHATFAKSDPAVPGIQNREWKLQREVELVLKRKLQSLIIDCISWTERPCENAWYWR